MRLIVGLGNPGSRYGRNRHNIGFMAVDEIVRRHNLGGWRSRFQGQISEGQIGAERVLAIKPQTYMNESGRAVGEALRFYKIDPSDVIVIYDEIDLRLGKVRVKKNGGAGGHNGIRSLDAHIGKDYWRVRLGVGHPGQKELVHNHVLSDFAKSEDQEVGKILDAIADELPLMLSGDDSAFMSRVAHHLTPPQPKPPQPKPAQPKSAQPEKPAPSNPLTRPESGS